MSLAVELLDPRDAHAHIYMYTHTTYTYIHACMHIRAGISLAVELLDPRVWREKPRRTSVDIRAAQRSSQQGSQGGSQQGSQQGSQLGSQQGSQQGSQGEATQSALTGAESSAGVNAGGNAGVNAGGSAGGSAGVNRASTFPRPSTEDGSQLSAEEQHVKTQTELCAALWSTSYRPEAHAMHMRSHMIVHAFMDALGEG